MLKKLQGVFLMVLCLILMVSSSFAVGVNQTLPANAKTNSISIKPVPVVTPNTTIAPIGKTIVVEGILKQSSKKVKDLILVCDKVTYSLTGNTKGMEKYINQSISVKGTLNKNSSIAVSFKPVLKPTPSPTPKVTVLKGKLEISTIEGKHFELITDKEIYVLTGKTDGIDKYEGQTVEVKGYVTDSLSIWMRGKVFQVLSYAPVTETTPIERYDFLQGYIKVIKTEITDKKITTEPYKFYLSTSDGVYELIGNTKGLEQYNGQKMEVKGHYVMTLVATDYPMFNVESYRPIIEPTLAPQYEVLQGTLKVIKTIINTQDGLLPSPYNLQLVTEKEIYTLQGNTEGLAKYEGQQIEVKGTVSPLEIYPPIFIVESYRPLIDPTPVPEYILLQGSLKVIKTDVLDYINSEKPYKFQLDTEDGPYTLEGDTGGLEKYDGLRVEVKGYNSMLKIYPPVFIVVSYKLAEDPQYDVLQGVLSVTKPDVVVDKSMDALYKFNLKTDTGLYELIGNTKGLEQYNGQKIEVKGHHVMTLLPQYPPMFNVVSYSIIETIPEISNTHTIISNKPLYFSAQKEGSAEVSRGNCTISWAEGTDKAFFNAKLTLVKDKQKSDYEFELAAVKTSTDESIIGLFNIRKDGIIVAKEIPGKLYGLAQPLNDYFKFYSDDMQWHMSAFITYRIDY